MATILVVGESGCVASLRIDTGVGTDYSIVTGIGGDVLVSSKTGEGTEFELIVPAMMGSRAELASPGLSDLPRRTTV